MDFAQLLAGRRSTRRFDTSRDIPDEVLQRVLAAPLTMPHAGNTYDWRGVVLRRRDRDPQTWPAIYSALMEQSYIEEAAVIIAYAVQPAWWAERYRANVETLVQRGLLDPARHTGLLATVDAGPPNIDALRTGLIGEAMMGVTAAMLTAIDAGLGATVTGSKPKELSVALGLPDDVFLCPWGVLALGWPAAEPGGGVGQSSQAPKPKVEDMYFGEGWGRPLPATVT
jgi:nitroreductase